MTNTDDFQPADFTDYAVGDRIHFWTNDNGYGGYGEIWRTGTVTKVTDKTITVACDGNGLGPTAVLRRATFGSRCATRAAAKQTPRDADHVQIVDDGDVVTALYIPDPEQAKNPKAVLDAPPTIDSAWEIEIVSEATRFYKRDGADFSGWVVRSRQGYSDPIPSKREAMQHLRDDIAAYFAP